MEFKYKASAAILLGLLAGVAGYSVITGDVSPAAGQIQACFPENASVCTGCTAV